LGDGGRNVAHLKLLTRNLLDAQGRGLSPTLHLPAIKILRLMTGARIGWVLREYDDAACADAAALAPEFLFADLERLLENDEPLWPGPWAWAVYEVRDLETARACQQRGAKFVESMTVRGLLSAYEEGRRQ
jgi:glycerophosphoryl diester phosphodiesterase